jgi:uncharacterized protein (DUF1499 family)
MLIGILKWFAVGLVLAVLLGIVAGRLGWLHGARPANLGVRDGRLKPPSAKPNSVSSQAALYPDHPRLAYARIEPLPLIGTAEATMERIAKIVAELPGARVVERREGYLYAVIETKLMRYHDDLEFWADPVARVVQVRSASRVGYSDRGVNRQRVESIRRALAG